LTHTSKMCVDRDSDACDTRHMPTEEVKQTPLTDILVRCHACLEVTTLENVGMDFETGLFTCEHCERVAKL
jgi:hypothetical protein